MKSKIVLLTTLLMLSFGISSFAQCNKQGGMENKKGCCMSKDITVEQKAKLDKLKFDLKKAMLPLKNQIVEKEAHLNTLMTADVADMDAINKTIDEISALKTQMAKLKAAHKQEVRKMLTPEQRLEFDMNMMENKEEGCGKGKGCHGGPGEGMEKGKCKEQGEHVKIIKEEKIIK